MPVSPDHMVYGDVTDYDAQVIGWLKEERANLFERLEKLETALHRIIELDHHNHGPESSASKIAREALNQRVVTTPVGWMGDISGTPFGPSDR